MKKKRTLKAFTLIVALCLSGIAIAQTGTYPIRPIRLIMPFAPGGSADNLGRTIQPSLGDTLGQQVIIDNRPGASSIIGTEIAAKSTADGYTLLLITTTYTVIPSLKKSLPYDPVKDFAGVSLLVSQANILAVHPSVPAKSVKELVALAKTKPLNFASGGIGSSPHLSGELLNLVAGTRMTHVPYKGSGPGVSDLIGGHVQLMFAGPLTFDQHIRAGKLRALAVADKKRSNVMPDLPTMAEAGFPGVETGTWYALLAPAATPRAVIEKLNKAIVSVLEQPVIKQRMAAQGVEIIGGTPAELDQYMRSEIAKWAKLVKAAKIQGQ